MVKMYDVAVLTTYTGVLNVVFSGSKSLQVRLNMYSFKYTKYLMYPNNLATELQKKLYFLGEYHSGSSFMMKTTFGWRHRSCE